MFFLAILFYGIHASRTSLDDSTLDIPPALDTNVPPDEDKRPSKDNNGDSGDQHDALRIAIRAVNRSPGRSADGVALLHRDAAVDLGPLALGVRRKILTQTHGEDVGPNGGGDGRADSASDARESILQRKHHRDVLVVGGGQDDDFLADDRGATAKGDEDLAHDDVANVDVRMAESDHESDAENGHGHAKVEGQPLDAAGSSDQETCDDAPEARTNAVDVDNVHGIFDRLVIYNQKERVEKAVPDVEAEESDAGPDAATKNGAVRKEVHRKESLGREEFLVQAKGNEKDNAKDQETYKE